MHEEQTQTSQLHPNGDKIGILEALAKVSKAIGAIGKDKTNTQQSFKYRSIDAVMSGIHDALADNDIVITTFHKEICNTERIGKTGTVAFYKEKDFTFCFRYKDGSKLETTVTGSGADYGDKVDNKCLSVALKYALTTTFIIPLQTDDPDGNSPETTKPKKKDVITSEDKTKAGRMFSDFCKKYFADQDMKAMFATLVEKEFGGKKLDQLTEAEGKTLVEVVTKHVAKHEAEAKKEEPQTPVEPTAPVQEQPVEPVQPQETAPVAPKEKSISSSDKMIAMTAYSGYCEKANPGFDKKMMFDAMVADKFNGKVVEDLTESEGKQLIAIIQETINAYKAQEVQTPVVEEVKEETIDELRGEDAYLEGQKMNAEQPTEAEKVDQIVNELPF